MSTKREQIISKAIEILKKNPQGIRYTQWIDLIQQALPDIPNNTIQGTVWNLDKKMPTEVYKPDRGLWVHATIKGMAPAQIKAAPLNKSISEDAFYEPFANYLTKDLEECTRAIKLGGSKFGNKWGTPDVIGVWKTNRSDPVQGEIILSAEIKLDNSAGSLITAFGQACAYKLFSHKVYLVIPKNSSEEDKSRIESLCLIFGIGLILFDSTSIENPDFEIRVRSLKQEPDLYYVNQVTKQVEKELFG